MMKPDGSDVQQITPVPYWHSEGRWSPDARQIACNTEEQSSTVGTSIAVMDASGNNRRLIAWGSQMSWSSDGKKILFTYCTDCEIGGRDFGLFLIDSDGQNRERLPIYGGYPDWSHDDTSVLIVAPESVGSTLVSQLMITHYPKFADSLFVGPQGAGYGAWSPNGRMIAFSMKVGGSAFSEIFVMSNAVESVRQVTSHQSPEGYYRPRWSPDGAQLIFLAVTLDGTGRSYLYMVGMDGTDIHRVLGDSTVSSVDWSW
jgi:Tol biopolymer transport system component